jgi:hypothetical protein
MMSVKAKHNIGKDEFVCKLRTPIGITLDSRDSKSEIHTIELELIATDWQ